MTTAKLCAASAIAGLATLTGCSDVKSCKEGLDPGCRNSAPLDDSGNCLYDLVATSTPDGVLCLEPGGDGGSVTVRDAGPDTGPDGSPPPNPCGCPSGQVCRNDGTCVNLCTPVSNPPTPKATLIPCQAQMGETDDFARAAIALCYQQCAHSAVYCGTSCDPETACTRTLAVTAATLACPTMDKSCAVSACVAARDLPCSQQQCTSGAPNCANTVCTNTCAMADYNNDGICDDGDTSNAISYACTYGSDCGDCGPRNGTAAPLKLDFGDVCADPSQCGGNLRGVKSSTGWCVPATNSQAYSRCVPDCSNGKTCPAGYECFGIASAEEGDGGMQIQFTDLNDGTPVFGCFPSACGG